MSGRTARGFGVHVLALTATLSWGPSVSAQSFDTWFESRIASLLDARLDSHVDLRLDPKQVGENGKGADRQRESPAANDRSTSLVDQSSATDFVSAAISFATVTAAAPAGGATTTGTSSAGAQTFTASLYALLAGLNGKPPADPTFYGQHVDARRASFTIGTAASDVKKDNTDKPGTVLGMKVLLFNGRELYKAGNLARLKEIQRQFSQRTAQAAALKARIQEVLFRGVEPTGVLADGSLDIAKFTSFLPSFGEQAFPVLLRKVDAQTLRRVDAEIQGSLASFASFRDALEAAYDQIHGAQQLAVVYSATVRPSDGNDDHRVELTFDYGLSPRVTWTANGSLDYVNRKTAASTTGGRIATEFGGDLTSGGEAWSRQPIRLSFSAQVAWGPDQQTEKDFQAKLDVPISGGLTLPIVYRYGSATNLSPGGSEAKLGLTIDIQRLIQSAK